MKSKRTFFVGALIFLGLAMPAFAAEDVPKQPSFARYEPMMNRSPFAVATAVAAPAATPNFAKDLYIANAARLANEGVVTLTSITDKNLKEYLSTKGPNLHGYTVSNIEWSDRVGATKVTIAKDGQFATLTFNQALLSQTANNAPPPQQQLPAPTLPPASYQGSNLIKPAPIPMLPTPPPRVRGMIQRNPVQNPAHPEAATENGE